MTATGKFLLYMNIKLTELGIKRQTYFWEKYNRSVMRVKPPSVQTSPAHASYTQQFLSVNVSNCAAQCQISWPATVHKQQRDSHA